MKIVVAATEEQERHIEELVEQMYTEIFPVYFSDEKIAEFDNLQILKPTTSDTYYNGTMTSAFKIMSSLQALIALLENAEDKDEKEYKEMFERNIDILQKYGYNFPLTLNHFFHPTFQEEVISKYGKAANKWII
ncbi:DUF5365 family protein [Metabacillus arenae]|uniref:YhcU family protein n=1 Tax=Metabacillus arenae TaxID=2771434 RepID=A0A926RYP2_9BACI|nr:DUF5365 family protein [Metabacillus arenae]MBD1382291.1 YhcU family protein [Metabacillus arenae]